MLNITERYSSNLVATIPDFSLGIFEGDILPVSFSRILFKNLVRVTKKPGECVMEYDYYLGTFRDRIKNYMSREDTLDGIYYFTGDGNPLYFFDGKTSSILCDTSFVPNISGHVWGDKFLVFYNNMAFIVKNIGVAKADIFKTVALNLSLCMKPKGPITHPGIELALRLWCGSNVYYSVVELKEVLNGLELLLEDDTFLRSPEVFTKGLDVQIQKYNPSATNSKGFEFENINDILEGKEIKGVSCYISVTSFLEKLPEDKKHLLKYRFIIYIVESSKIVIVLSEYADDKDIVTMLRIIQDICKDFTIEITNAARKKE